MKNVLLYCERDVSPLMGGTERITISLGNALRDTCGCKVYLAYANDCVGYNPAPYDDKLKIRTETSEATVKEFLRVNDIGFIIIQGEFDRVKYFRSVLAGDKSVKIVFCYHFAPGWDMHFDIWMQTKKIWERRGIINKFEAIIRLFYYFVSKPVKLARYKRRYREVYALADRVVLLSERFKDEYREFSGLTGVSEIIGIPNMLSFNYFLDKSEIEKKENVVLVVSRFDEEQKRISYALKIWEIVKRDPRSNGWRLELVAGGDDESRYRRYVEEHNTPDVFFMGRRDPIPFYRRASLFMMTSRSEGWGLTLTESQQNGVLPIAFDSFSSLHDIIVPGVSGCIINNNDLAGYAECMLGLMYDRARRINLAVSCVDYSRRFKSDVIARRWQDVLESIE